MAKSRSPSQINFTIQVSERARNSFERLHEKLGFKARGLTFEALVFNAALADLIDPREIASISTRLDYILQRLDLP